MDQLSTLEKASLGSFWRNLICTVAWSPLGEEDISTKDLVLCQSTCCAMRVFPYFSNVISNLRLNMHREGWALSLPNTSRPCGHVQGLFKTAWLKSDQSSSKQTQEPSNLRCFYMNIQMGGFGLPQPAATLNSTLQTDSTQVFSQRQGAPLSATRLLSLVLQSTLNPVWNVCILTTLACTFPRAGGNCPQGLCWP